MLDSVPSEVLEHIISYLPNVSSIVNIACANRKLHATISANQYAIFRDFVQASFPSIRTPPLWQDMARQLTSRSRAWDRRAFFARECYPHINDASGPPWLDLSAKFGYTPVIDSYEQYCGGSYKSRKEVLAYGAAGRLRLRTMQNGQCRWMSLQFPDDHLPQHDILDVKLLKPEEHPERDGDALIIRRADRSVSKVETNYEEQACVETTQYLTGASRVDCMDVGIGTDAQLAVFDKKTLKMFPLHASGEKIHPTLSASISPKFSFQNKRRCAKFLTNEMIATSVQYFAGHDRAPILLYDITSTGIVNTSLAATQSITSGDALTTGRHSAAVLAKLDSTGSLTGRPGQAFLSGWTDGGIHLHDLRSPSQPVTSFYDPVDNGKILSLATCGHEKFFAGSHQNGCLKVFDMRMPGSRAYSYINDIPSRKATHRSPAAFANDMSDVINIDSLTLYPKTRSRRDINIFLAMTVNQKGRLWEPLPPQDQISEPRNPFTSGPNNNTHHRNQGRRGGQQNRNNNNNSNNYSRYRGSIYSLSTPSPSSSTLFAGIENHVIQLDFISTDDVRRRIIELPSYEPGGLSNSSTSKGPSSKSKSTKAAITQQRLEIDIETERFSDTNTGTNANMNNNTTSSSSSLSHQNDKRHDYHQILNLSCYEQPRPGYEATDPVLLRKQIPFSIAAAASAPNTFSSGSNDSNTITSGNDIRNGDHDGNDDDNDNNDNRGSGFGHGDLERFPENGWDERWRLGRSWRNRRSDES